MCSCPSFNLLAYIISILKILLVSKHFSTTPPLLPCLHHNYHSSDHCNHLPHLFMWSVVHVAKCFSVEDSSYHVTPLHRTPRYLPISLSIKVKLLTIFYKAQPHLLQVLWPLFLLLTPLYQHSFLCFSLNFPYTCTISVL